MPNLCLALLLFLVPLQSVLTAPHSSSKYRVCYYPSWATLSPYDIDGSLCTHILFAFAEISSDGLLVASSASDIPLYNAINDWKNTIDCSVKVLLSVGGSVGMKTASDMMSTIDTRHAFINSTLVFLRQYGFDGLDLDFEYPAQGDSPPGDKQRYVSLLHELRQAYDGECFQMRRPRLLLTAAVPAGKWAIDPGYDIPAVCDLLDFVNVMSYDYHGPWENITQNGAPLLRRAEDQGVNVQLNVQWTANYWVAGGCPRYKMNIGVPFYGYMHTLVNGSDHGIGAVTTNPKAAYTYSQICGLVSSGKVIRVFDIEELVPYAYNTTTLFWIGYDDVISVSIKVAWIVENHFAGFMVWNLDQDDWSGTNCGQGRFPLLRAMNQALHRRRKPTWGRSENC